MHLTWLTDLQGLLAAFWNLQIPCMFQKLTGLYCPGCGGTRAVKHLLGGDFLLSIQYHPFVLYTAVAVFLTVSTWILSKLLKRPGLYFGRIDKLAYVGVAVVLVNWIFKNYMLVVKGIDLLP